MIAVPVAELLDRDLARWGMAVDVGDLAHWRDAAARIVRTPGVCSGVPRIEDTRTPVSTVRAWWDEGADDATVLAAYPHLTAADLDSVRAWLAPLRCAAVLRDAEAVAR